MKISTTITKAFFEMKMADLKDDGYFTEFKEMKPFWIKRLDNFCAEGEANVEIVMLVGNKPHRFKAISVWKVHRGCAPAKYRGAIKTDFAYAITCVPLEVDTKISKLALATAGY